MKKRCFVGFDGFIDTLARVVKSRQDSHNYTAFSSISQWADSLKEAAGKSCNFELTEARLCAGGNAINVARALSALGYSVNCAANMGAPNCPLEIDPLFSPYISNFEQAINLGAAGQTHALEFQDGKLLLGIQGKNANLTLSDLEKVLGAHWAHDFIWNHELIALVNWTMTPNLGKIWRHLALHPPKQAQKHTLLIDLADPKKRNSKELARDLYELEPLCNEGVKVILSMNRSEAEQVLAALGEKPLEKESLSETLSLIAEQIRQKLPGFVIVVHDSQLSVLSQNSQTFVRLGEIIKSPRVLTGGGDHFNAGLAHGLLQEKNPADCLDLAMKSAGYYIKNGQSPQSQDLS